MPICNNCRRPVGDCAANYSQDCWKTKAEQLQHQLECWETKDKLLQQPQESDETVVSHDERSGLAQLEGWFIGALHTYRETQLRPAEPRLPIKYQILGTNLGMLLTLARRALDPLAIRICCEACGQLHIDVGEFKTKVHHTHSCQYCGLTWRPAVSPTVGVKFLPGFKNEAPPDP